jgi:hypothetical protein
MLAFLVYIAENKVKVYWKRSISPVDENLYTHSRNVRHQAQEGTWVGCWIDLETSRSGHCIDV